MQELHLVTELRAIQSIITQRRKACQIVCSTLSSTRVLTVQVVQITPTSIKLFSRSKSQINVKHLVTLTQTTKRKIGTTKQSKLLQQIFLVLILEKKKTMSPNVPIIKLRVILQTPIIMARGAFTGMKKLPCVAQWDSLATFLTDSTSRNRGWRPRKPLRATSVKLLALTAAMYFASTKMI